ncbi:hypothetical protein VT84_06840 [Gemmata sp. SH-PL17]|uniref:hypothetical protein n=1 Tax=Gemmata sp. SH-PL17 TaxID=1630693 RepID=UPI00078C2ABF|nr:hypothetical protein [Gemmata sp. SH-PL17]AMV24095.1 hypothetical protein VT84_06840 [Gemmata sp. SH-PL17]
MNTQRVRVTFRGRECLVFRSRHPNGGTAVCLLDAEHGGFAAWATLNTPLADLKPGQVVVNDFDRSEGLLEALVSARVVEPTGEQVRFLGLALPVATLSAPIPELERPGTAIDYSTRKEVRTHEIDSGREW